MSVRHAGTPHWNGSVLLRGGPFHHILYYFNVFVARNPDNLLTRFLLQVTAENILSADGKRRHGARTGGAARPGDAGDAITWKPRLINKKTVPGTADRS